MAQEQALTASVDIHLYTTLFLAQRKHGASLFLGYMHEWHSQEIAIVHYLYVCMCVRVCVCVHEWPSQDTAIVHFLYVCVCVCVCVCA